MGRAENQEKDQGLDRGDDVCHLGKGPRRRSCGKGMGNAASTLGARAEKDRPL